MPIEHLLKVAQDHYARARVTANPVAKRALIEIGDTYLNEAEKLKRGRAGPFNVSLSDTFTGIVIKGTICTRLS